MVHTHRDGEYALAASIIDMFIAFVTDFNITRRNVKWTEMQWLSSGAQAFRNISSILYLVEQICYNMKTVAIIFNYQLVQYRFYQ